MKQRYILSLDQGTTSSRAILFDRNGRVVTSARREYTQIYPKPGWVEHDPEEIWSSQASVAVEAITMAGIAGSEIAAVGIANQRETTILWDRRSGRALYNAIVWQDRRTAGYCDRLMAEGYGGMVASRTGLIIDAYFSATKIRWILDHVEGAAALAASGHLAFGTVDTWLLWKMTGGELHVTDVTNASRTMLFNIETMCWDSDLLELFSIPASLMPEVRSSSEVYGMTTGIFPSPIPVAAMAGDQQAALFGQMCIEEGMVKNTYGTGCFMMMNTGSRPIFSDNRLLTTVAWQRGGETVYALEGSIFIGGAVVQWLHEGLGIIESPGEAEALAQHSSRSDGIYFVPAFAGLGAPWWNPHARGMITGLTRGSTAAAIARAALDSIAYQTLDVLLAMERDAQLKITELRADGGAAVNDMLMQFQADLLQAEVIRPLVTETTALGAAFLAGLATGFWAGEDELKELWQADARFTPSMGPGMRERLIRGWHRSVRAAEGWADGDNS